MSQAYLAATLVHAYCRDKWPNNEDANGGNNMGSTMFDSFTRAFERKGGGSHKYIPADEWTATLGERQGAGVYGYQRMADDSYVLLTCKGPLAVADDMGVRWVD